MIDGRLNHGGLSDRLFGIVSAFQYCQEHEIEFRINFVYPFQLEQFLVPNEYDWRIRSDEISYNIFQSKPLYISLFSHKIETMQKYAEARLKTKFEQVHLYSNMIYFSKKDFKYYFNILFKKSNILDNAVKENLARIKGSYISITFRFQQLLGDLRETGFRILENELEKEELINRCINCIEKLFEKTKSKILVTSDSITFLESVKKLPYVYIIPGKIVHMDYVSKQDSVGLTTHMKSFVDLFMLANAKAIYLADIFPLYHSSFPMVASWIYGKDYYVVDEFLNTK